MSFDGLLKSVYIQRRLAGGRQSRRTTPIKTVGKGPLARLFITSPSFGQRACNGPRETRRLRTGAVRFVSLGTPAIVRSFGLGIREQPVTSQQHVSVTAAQWPTMSLVSATSRSRQNEQVTTRVQGSSHTRPRQCHPDRVIWSLPLFFFFFSY